jgi:hypothetical protein
MTMDFTYEGAYDIDPDNGYVNMANGNARAILRVLDLDTDGGSTSAEDFIARIEMARAIGTHAEAERPTVEVGGPGTGQALFIDCGLSLADIENRLDWLLELAETARDRGAQVQWF